MSYYKITPISKLEQIWTRFVDWDYTAIQLISTIRKWRRKIFYLSVTGAFIGVLSASHIYLKVKYPQISPIYEFGSRVLALFSTVLISIAAFAGGRFLAKDEEKTAVEARTVAETYRSDYYLYLFDAGIFAGNRDQVADQRDEDIDIATKDMIVVHPDEGPSQDHFITEPNIELYVNERIMGQRTYFEKKIKTFRRKISRMKNLTFLLGISGIALGASATVYPDKMIMVWVAFLGTVTASISSYVATGRYQQQMTAFNFTKRQLDRIYSRWLSRADRTNAQLVEAVEAELMRENQAWADDLKQTSNDSKTVQAFVGQLREGKVG